MQFSFRGTLHGHNGWVTAIVPVESQGILVTASRDKTLLVWKLLTSEQQIAVPVKSLRGHSHFVEDVAVSSDGYFAVSGSWDNTLRLWSLTTGQSTKLFVGHTREVLSVAFSPDSRQIASASRDGTIKLWNTVGECKYTGQSHRGWVSNVQFFPNRETPTLISTGWDFSVKTWELALKVRLEKTEEHTGTINALSISSDGVLAATGGKDKHVIVWDLSKEDAGSITEVLRADVNDTVNALAWSSNRQLLAAATESGVKVWKIVDNVISETWDLNAREDKGVKAKRVPAAVSIAWSADCSNLFVGFNDNAIRVWTTL